MTKDEFYEFMREQTLRHERSSRDMQLRLGSLEDRTAAQTGVLEELLEESRAQRQALFRIFDQLGPDEAAG